MHVWFEIVHARIHHGLHGCLQHDPVSGPPDRVPMLGGVLVLDQSRYLWKRVCIQNAMENKQMYFKKYVPGNKQIEKKNR